MKVARGAHRDRTTLRRRASALAAALALCVVSAPAVADEPEEAEPAPITVDPVVPPPVPPPPSKRDARWGQWIPADEGQTPIDIRMGVHASRISLASSSVGSGRHGRDYGFRRPTTYALELAFSAFTSKNLSLGILFQPAAFGGQDVAAPADGEHPSHTRSPFVLGTGALVEGGWSLGPVLFRPGVGTGPRVVMLIQDRSGKQSPPAVVQWFVDVRGAAEVALGRDAAIGVGMSLDALRPTDWGAFAYLSWRIGDIAAATR